MMMRVALITSRFPFGSKEAFLKEEIAELSRACDAVVMPALPTSEEPAVTYVPSVRLRLLSVPVLLAAAAECARRPARAFRALRSVLAAPKSLEGKIKNLCIFPTGLAAGRYVRRHGIEHVHAYWLAIPATVAYIAATMNDIPWSATGHRYDLVDSNMSAADVSRTFLADARFIRTISRSGERLVRGALGPASDPMVVTEHLGVRVPNEPAPIRREATLRLVCAANLEHVKGHRTLLDAISRAVARGTQVRCTIAGSGTLGAELEAYARTLGIGAQVEFVGNVPHDRLLAAFEQGCYDAAILTSVDEGPHECEGIPIFLAECMAAGLPVIATNSGAVSELVDSSNGILCDPCDAEAVAAAIASFARDPNLRARLAEAGRATITTRFDVRANASRVARLLAGSAA